MQSRVRGEQNKSIPTSVEEEKEIIAASLREHEESQLRAAREASMALSGGYSNGGSGSGGGNGCDQMMLDQALKVGNVSVLLYCLCVCVSI